MRALGAGAWDVGFSFNPDEYSGGPPLVFTTPFMGVDNTYLAAPNSPIYTITDADQEGVRIAVVRFQNPDIYLTRTLTKAKVVRADTSPAAWALVKSGEADVFGGGLGFVRSHQAELPGSRIIEGRFMVGVLAMAIPQGRTAGLEYLEAFMKGEKSSGVLAGYIKDAGVAGSTLP